jgi:hypothetical protein
MKKYTEIDGREYAKEPDGTYRPKGIVDDVLDTKEEVESLKEKVAALETQPPRWG